MGRRQEEFPFLAEHAEHVFRYNDPARGVIISYSYIHHHRTYMCEFYSAGWRKVYVAKIVLQQKIREKIHVLSIILFY